MTRDELQEKFRKLKEAGLNFLAFERNYSLPERTLKDLMDSKSFSNKRIAKVIKALEDHKKNILEIL